MSITPEDLEEAIEQAQARLTEYRPLGATQTFDNPREWRYLGLDSWISSDDNVAVVRARIAKENVFLAFWRDYSVMGYQGTEAWRHFKRFDNPEVACAAIDAHWDEIYT